MGRFSKMMADGTPWSDTCRGGAETATPRARRSGHRLARRGAIALATALASGSVLPAPAHATRFLDDFEGDGETSQVPALSLRNWDIITSVDLMTESSVPPFCHLSGSCIDLVGSVGANTGGIVTKESWPLGDYLVGFFLYGSGRDGAGGAVPSGGTVSRIRVHFGPQLIYAKNDIPSDFERFVVVRVRGSGKLRFEASGGAVNIGPLLDNALVLPAGD
jgi:hypothetical protein